MKPSTAALSIATLSLAMLTPAFGQAYQNAAPNGQNNPSQLNPSQNNSGAWNNNANSGWHNSIRGQREAERMVPARAALSETLKSGDAAGYQFRARLRDTVHLDDGVELHKGDTLIGHVTTDDMNMSGMSRLAVRFNRALLKDGQTVPIKATIVAFHTPGDLAANNTYGMADEVPNTWNDGTLRVDQVNVMHNVDLHSRIASHNSGVFVSTKDNNFAVPRDSELDLAISGRPNGQANPMNSGY